MALCFENKKNATICDEEILKLPKCTWSDVASGDFSLPHGTPRGPFMTLRDIAFYPTLDNQFHLLAWGEFKLV